MLHLGEDGGFEWATRTELREWLTLHQEHSEIPILVIAAYLVFVSYGPKFITSPWNVKPLLVAWNAFLAIYSMVGSYYTLIAITDKVGTDGFKSSVCAPGEPWWFEGAVGFFAMTFCYSKFLELFDTAFLVVRKKDVIFLHWYHHVTVLLYCWFSYHLVQTKSIWFSLINFIVHSMMYTYFAFAILGVKAVYKFSMAITAIQIAQMVAGMGILVFIWMEMGEDCVSDLANLKLGLAMYISYFVLFGSLFFEKYMSQKKTETQKTGPKTKRN